MTLTHPPLQSGDRLTRVEFERRYAAMHDRKAELIDGVVYGLWLDVDALRRQDGARLLATLQQGMSDR